MYFSYRLTPRKSPLPWVTTRQSLQREGLTRAGLRLQVCMTAARARLKQKARFHPPIRGRVDLLMSFSGAEYPERSHTLLNAFL